MTKTQKPKRVKKDSVDSSSTNNSQQTDWSPGDPAPTYVVVRHTYGIQHRVSNREYKTKNDPAAITERDFWNRVIQFHPDGTRVEIVQFEKRRHRVW